MTGAEPSTQMAPSPTRGAGPASHTSLRCHGLHHRNTRNPPGQPPPLKEKWSPTWKRQGIWSRRAPAGPGPSGSPVRSKRSRIADTLQRGPSLLPGDRSWDRHTKKQTPGWERQPGLGGNGDTGRLVEARGQGRTCWCPPPLVHRGTRWDMMGLMRGRKRRAPPV